MNSVVMRIFGFMVNLMIALAGLVCITSCCAVADFE